MSYYARLIEGFLVYGLLLVVAWALLAVLVLVVGWVLF